MSRKNEEVQIVVVDDVAKEEKNMELIKILEKAAELGNSVDAVNKEIKKNASVRCRLKSMPGRADFAQKMADALAEEELLKAVKAHLVGPTKNVNTLTPEAIEEMDYITVCKAIRSIQSKKTHTRWADDCERDADGMFIEGTGAAFKEACRIEEMLKARRDVLQPVKASAVYLSADENTALRSILASAMEMFASSNGDVDYAGFGEDSMSVMSAILDKLPEVSANA